MPNFVLPDGAFEEAARRFPTPFHLYDEQGIRSNARALNAAFSWCEDFEEYFAVKALPNPAILRILKEVKCGVDCSSETELMLAKACGFSGRDVMFSANAMPDDEFRMARELGAYVNLDDISHIDILRTHGGIPETVCCRYNPGGDFKIGTFVMGNPGEAKYGFTYPQLQEGLAQLRELGAKRFGLHAFLSSNNTDDAYYPTLARILFAAGQALKRQLDVVIDYVIEDELPRVKALTEAKGAGLYYIVLTAEPAELEARIVRRGDTALLQRALFLKRKLDALPENKGRLLDNTHSAPEESVRSLELERYLVR